MNTATLILIIAGSLAATLVLYALVMFFRQGSQSGNSSAALWPPTFFLEAVRREPPPTAQVPRVTPAQAEAAPPTAEFTRPLDLSQLDSTSLKTPSSAHTPPTPDDIEMTNRVSHILEEARRQAANQPEVPVDRTSQFARPIPPSEDPDAQ